MSGKRVIWHVGLERVLQRRGPSSFEIRSEVPLSDESLRVDYLLLRKQLPAGEGANDGAQTLRRLWPMLPRVSVVEYKSPSHPYRSGSLDRLWGYVHTYFANERALPRQRADGTPLGPGAGGPDVLRREDLGAVLIVPCRTPSLDADIAEMGLVWEDLGDGYWRVRGGLFALWVVEIDVVGPAEDDDLLYSFGHGEVATPEARWFWMEFVGMKDAAMSMQDMEGYEELLQKFVDSLPTRHTTKAPGVQDLAIVLPPSHQCGRPAESAAGVCRGGCILVCRRPPCHFFKSATVFLFFAAAS